MKIAIVGLGLIGGSLAKTIKKNTNHEVIGLDINREVLVFSKSVGAIDEIGDTSSLAKADVTIICLYPDKVVPFVLENRTKFKPDSIVTDTAGIKSHICWTLEDEDLDFTFIGGHPMAGREVSGFENSLDDMFNNASYIFTPLNAAGDQVETLKRLAMEMKFGSTVITTPERHDEIIAYTSQIAHVLACAYVLSPRSREHAGFSAGSFMDVSRVAKINEELWTQLFIDNKETLCEEIDTLLGNLQEIKDCIENGRADKLKAILKKGREIKEELDR